MAARQTTVPLTEEQRKAIIAPMCLFEDLFFKVVLGSHQEAQK